jgi:S-formylglutathione hydrolase FrmB
VISRRFQRLFLVFAIAATMLLPQAVPIAQAISADSGAKVVSQTQVDLRTFDLTVTAPSLNGKTTPVRILLPVKWFTEPDRTFPVLYLMHGCCYADDNTYWTNMTNVDDFLADKDVITVLPTSGDSGYYSDHWNYGSRDKRSDSETFHTVELVQILQRGYRADTKHMAVAGLSLAGYGAMEYAADHPGLFKSAASYSGFPDIQSGYVNLLMNLTQQRNKHDPLKLWGDSLLQRNVWTEHNPAAKAAKLRGVNLFISAGNGQPGPFDPPAVDPLATVLEQIIERSSKSFVAKLQAANVPITTDFYGPGVHNWPYWEREFKESWPVLAKGLGLSS